VRTIDRIVILPVLIALVAGGTGCSRTPEERRASIYELQASPSDDNQERIRELLGDPDRDVRATALNALVTVGADDAEQLALASLDDEDGFVRSMAAKLLGDLQNGAHAGALVARLEADPDPWVRRRAAEALTELGGDEAIRGLGVGLEDPMEPVRLAAITGVRKLGPQEFKGELSRMLLEDPAWEIRVQAARALGLTGDPEMRVPLDAALGDENEFVRSAASHALGQSPAYQPRLPAGEPVATPDATE
jgi:HEAT repeat protein